MINLALLIFSLHFNSFAADIPQSWIQDSSKGHQEFVLPGKKSSALIEKFARSHLTALSGATLNNHADFKLETVAVDFGVTHEGYLGLLPFNGTSAVTAYWHKKNAKTLEMPENNLVYNMRSLTNIDSETEFLVKLIKNSGRVKVGKKLFEDIKNLLKDFAVLAEKVAQVDHPYWQATKMSIEKGITVAGRIGAFGDGGIGLRLIVHYSLLQKKTASRDSVEAVYLLADTLCLAQEGQTFKPKSVSVGLGLTPSLSVGIARVKFEALGHIEFVPRPDGDSSRCHVAKNLPDDILNHLDPERLRVGMENSMKMANWFVGEFSKYEKEDWELGAIDTSFDMGTKGDMVLSLLSGRGTFTMKFEL